MLIEVSEQDFNAFAKPYHNQKSGNIGLDILYSGDSGIIFRKGAVIAVVAKEKFYLSETVVKEMRPLEAKQLFNQL